MIEVLIGLGIIIVVIWALIGLVIVMSEGSQMNISFGGFLLLFAPWIAGALFAVGVLAYNIGSSILH